MTTSPLIIPVARFFTVSGGAALAGGKVYTYAAGTNTPKATYTDFSGDTQNTNPVILDSAGEADIWLDGNYKINLTDSNDVQQANYPVDNVSSFSTTALSEYGVTTGTANNYILSPAPALLGYTAGNRFNIKINATNTGPASINISALGPQAIVKLGSTALTGGELVAGSIYTIIYDGVNFQFLGSTIFGFKGVNVPSATPSLADVIGAFVHITGTTTITSFGTAIAGALRYVTFDGILTLTHNATSLILPGAANIVTAANDSAAFVSEGAGNWRCLSYTLAAGGSAGILPVANGGTGRGTLTASSLLVGNGTSQVQLIAPGAVNNVLTSNGTDFISAALSSVPFTGVASGNGYIKLGSIYIQWGNTSTITTNFPIAFPTACLWVSVSLAWNSAAAVAGQYQYIASQSTTSFTTGGAPSGLPATANWIAIGN